MKHSFLQAGLLGLLCTLAWPAWAGFTDNNDGTITDTTTGLVWDKCSRGQTWDNTTPPGTCSNTPTASSLSWQDALKEATAANTASHRGHTDWRLPNATELESLVKMAATNPTIEGAAFPNTPSNWFWSSTTYAPNPAGAWGVSFGNGGSIASGKANTGHVRLVRSGQWFGAFDALDATAPVLSSVAVTNTTTTATTLQATSNESATGYWVAVAQGSAAPLAAQVRAGQDAGGSAVALTGSDAMAATQKDFAVTGLASGTAYTLYLVAEDASGNLSTVSSTNVTTLAPAVNGACGSAHGVAVLAAPAANLCSAGVAGSVASAADAFTWSCAGTGGGSTSMCSAPRQYSVTPAHGAGGSMSPNTAQAVTYNATTSFTVAPNAGYAIGAVSGCGGALVGNTYTTEAVTGACTVTASFAAVSASFSGTTVPSVGGTAGPASASFTGGGTCRFDSTGTAFVAAPATLPAGQTMPHGMFQFRLVGCTPGATVIMSVTWPQPVQGLTKFGKATSAGDPSTHFTPTGLQVSGNTTTFTVTDGQKGDDDWAQNGTIVDPVGPVMAAALGIPTLGEWSLALLSLLAAAMGMGALRRRGMQRV